MLTIESPQGLVNLGEVCRAAYNVNGLVVSIRIQNRVCLSAGSPFSCSPSGNVRALVSSLDVRITVLQAVQTSIWGRLLLHLKFMICCHVMKLIGRATDILYEHGQLSRNDADTLKKGAFVCPISHRRPWYGGLVAAMALSS